MGNITILLYHQVDIRINGKMNLDCFCNLKTFEKQMFCLYNNNITVISLDKAVDLINSNTKLDKKYVVLTFDDGYETFYNLVYPILKRYNFLSTLYPVVGYLNNIAGWVKDFNPDLKLLTEQQLVELSKQGVNIGAHSINHYKLDTLNDLDLLYEIKGSKLFLQKLLDKEITTFSYPHGKYNKKVITHVKNLGFKNAVTCINNFANNTCSLFELPRKYITYFDDEFTILKKL